ncbi:unnamed protein product [Urochloa decumbens]|uniref:Ubiquitin-like protease family profile domain-containing protein n=1 Tax=Urochloa decumbens TaxID=240449 RepID=A0ABC9BB61_9POAL
MDTGQRLVHRMPNNPKIVAFESTQHRFEVPLRPELWSSYAGSGGPVSPPQLHPTPSVGPRSNASADSTGDFTDVPDKGRKKPVRRKRNVSDIHNKDSMHAGGSRRMKKQQPSHRPSKQKNVAADRSRRLTDYFHSSEGLEILLPVLHRQHWSVYCVNLGQSRIDVLDSMDYSSDGDNSWDSYHSHMGKTIMQRLSDALSKAAPRKFVSFKNWRHVKVKVPVHKSLYDSAFFAMKFLEFYDGDGHGSLKADIAVDRSKEQRAEMLYYLTFHSENKLHPLPEALLQFRISDHHPFFY